MDVLSLNYKDHKENLSLFSYVGRKNNYIEIRPRIFPLNQNNNDIEILESNFINTQEIDNELEYLNKLLLNHKYLNGKEIENLINKIPLNNNTFNYIISQIYKSPDSYKLDLLLSCLSNFNEEKYNRVIDYIRNSTINKYIRSYLIETISIWNKINSNKRIKDLKNILSKENDTAIQKIIKDTINEIE